MMREEAISFGTDYHMIGIYGRSDHVDMQRPTILIWNAGLSHRIGPQRHWVELARLCQDDGFDVFRFDLTGLGDSEPRRGAMDQEEREVQDIRAAMDYVERKTGQSRFIVIGLCSGAANAHPAAVKDERIVGMVMIDGYGYPTERFFWHYYRTRLFSWQSWQRFAKRKTEEIFKTKEDRESFFRSFPPREKMAAEIQALVHRGVEMFYLYTGGVPDYFNYREQFYDMFPEVTFGSQLRLEYHADADHLFTALDTKERYFRSIREWLADKF